MARYRALHLGILYSQQQKQRLFLYEAALIKQIFPLIRAQRLGLAMWRLSILVPSPLILSALSQSANEQDRVRDKLDINPLAETTGWLQASALWWWWLGLMVARVTLFLSTMTGSSWLLVFTAHSYTASLTTSSLIIYHLFNYPAQAPASITRSSDVWTMLCYKFLSAIKLVISACNQSWLFKQWTTLTELSPQIIDRD